MTRHGSSASALFSPQRARLRCALGAACRGPLLPAFHASAPPRRNVIAIIVPPVIVGDLISGTNGLDRAQDDLALGEMGFCIWPACMVGVAAEVASARRVYG